MQAPHEITYTLTSRDYAAAMRALLHTPWWQRLIPLGACVIALWAFTAMRAGIYNPVVIAELVYRHGPAWLPAAALGLLLLGLSGPWIGGAMTAMYFRQLAAANATLHITLADDAVTSRASIGSSVIPWHTIRRVLCTRESLILALSKREAVILPRRGFVSDAAFAAAHDYALARLAASRGA
ncbi:MAG: YcxB family protein [Bordetella sp.]|nr:YcxB family protein [Bordetella sp.]